ncbi:MAG: hypothetical protein KA204_05450 [Chromatiaceae bacterium]|nr:hypothetical protein [Chromatiaceae bacterium]MBP6807185.1 hypothetical protein [Chromatiaceae bacterium]MBP8289121.1 hypothetical protein [Chromatiaceae bacterium]
MAKSTTTIDISIMEIQRGRIDFLVLGTTPMICNAMSGKAAGELLLPSPKKNAAEKAANLKHNPLEEYRNSVYKTRGDSAPTRIYQLPTCFKKAIISAALDIPGATKSQMGRLISIIGDQIYIYGIPQLHMSIVRMADMNRTPDVRTRVILPRWAAYLTVEYTKPIIKDQAVINLLAAAGITQGIGDWRVQKGSGNYGQFSLVGTDNTEFSEIVTTGGRAAQDAALADPLTYNAETDELLSWFSVESKRRGFKIAA